MSSLSDTAWLVPTAGLDEIDPRSGLNVPVKDFGSKDMQNELAHGGTQCQLLSRQHLRMALETALFRERRKDLDSTLRTVSELVWTGYSQPSGWRKDRPTLGLSDSFVRSERGAS